MAFRWGSKISTIRLGSKRLRVSNFSKTVCRERMQLLLPNSRRLGRFSLERRICTGWAWARRGLIVTLGRSATLGTPNTFLVGRLPDRQPQWLAACAMPHSIRTRLDLADCPQHAVA